MRFLISQQVSNTHHGSLFARILKAREDGEQFKILISIPLVPGMCGQIKGDGFSGIGCVMHFQFRTMSHGGQSLYERLRVHGIDPEKYIFITGLRTHQEVRAYRSIESRRGAMSYYDASLTPLSQPSIWFAMSVEVRAQH